MKIAGMDFPMPEVAPASATMGMLGGDVLGELSGGFWVFGGFRIVGLGCFCGLDFFQVFLAFGV